MSITVTDLFCGAGGSSSGAVAVPGVQVRMAANHWSLAIETHNTNHPDTDHDCADLSQVDPRRYPRTDILWASPECTNHSQAKGRKRNVDATPDIFGDTLPDEAAERSRATMWDVPRFAEHHRYKAIIVENVVDAVKWIAYPGWLYTMQCLGYEVEVVYLNSMHAQAMGLPAPQSRDRVYFVFWLKGNRRPDFEKWLRPEAFCPEHGLIRAMKSWKKPDGRWGRYRAQYVYRCPRVECRNAVVEPGWLPAAYAIDWSLAGQRIGDRAKPLAAKTVARIEAGLRKHWSPIHLEAAGNTFERRPGVRSWPVSEELRTLHTTASKGLAYAEGMLIDSVHGAPAISRTDEPMRTQTTAYTRSLLIPVEGRDGKQAQVDAEPMRTMTTRNETGVCVPPFMLERRFDYRTRSVDEPISTLTANDTSKALVVPMRNNNTVKDAEREPLDTVAANGNHHGLLIPYYGTDNSATTDDPMRTVSTVDRFAMITRQNTARGDQGQMSTPVDEPLRTLTTAGHQSLTEWEGELPAVEDCLFRMLEPHEIKVGMAFAHDYLLLGNKREQVKLAGNAVTPPAARDLIACVAESLGQEVALP